jgi:hypothetical protein
VDRPAVLELFKEGNVFLNLQDINKQMQHQQRTTYKRDHCRYLASLLVGYGLEDRQVFMNVSFNDSLGIISERIYRGQYANSNPRKYSTHTLSVIPLIFIFQSHRLLDIIPGASPTLATGFGD